MKCRELLPLITLTFTSPSDAGAAQRVGGSPSNRFAQLLALLVSPQKGSKITKKIQGTSRLSKQVVEIIVRPNPEPMDLFTIPAANGAIFC
ncbi:MAG: hypothetical protein NTZ94_00315 [Verrucomicrobia bacterium]|nr:hypothetical protein [Verrucomicrobiota bacterium]